MNTLAAANSSNTIPNLDDARITRSGVVVAVSLRRLFDDYTGPLVRVRRSGDNRKRNLPVDGNGDPDTAALVSWVNAAGGTKNGYVVRWYDQSGQNYHASAGKEHQPVIVSNGALVTENAKPALRFAGPSGVPRAVMATAAGAASRFNGRDVPLSTFVVAKLDSLTTSQMMAAVVHMQSDNAQGKFIAPYHFGVPGGNSVRAWRGLGNDPVKRIILEADYPTDQAIMSYVFTGTSGRIWQNARAISDWTDQTLGAAVAYNRLMIGGKAYRSRERWLSWPLFAGNIQEIILYNQDRRFGRAAIEANIIKFYHLKRR